MIRVVTRKSQLAQRQTAIAINALSSLYTDIDFKIMPVTAQGDDQRHQRFLKGGFTKTLEESLMSGFADIAIHSLKDLSVDNTPSLIVGGVLKRTEPRDVFVSIDYPDIASMPQGTLVGTCSPRRAAIINHYYPWLNVVDCRGDVLTRIEKLKRGDFSGIILAGAGLERLGLEEMIGEYLSTQWMPPAIGQGVIALQCREDDFDTRQMLQSVNDQKTKQCVNIERKLGAQLGVGCNTPVGIYARTNHEYNHKIDVIITLSEPDGGKMIRDGAQIDISDVDEIDYQLQVFVKKLHEQGARDIIDGSQYF